MKLKKEKTKQLPTPPAPKTQDLPIFPLPGMEAMPKLREPLPEEFFPPKIPKIQQKPAEFSEKPRGPSPPLFIKVSKYKEIVQNINQLKSYILALRDAVDAMREIHAELNKALGIASRTLDHVNSMTSAIDTRMVAMHEPEEGIIEPAEPAEPPADIEAYIKDLYNHMEKIKSELRAISPE